jgi:hypothetical protein
LSLIAPEYYSALSEKLKTKEEITSTLINSKIVGQILIIVIFLLIIVLLINTIPRLLSFNSGIKVLLIELVIVFAFIGVIEYYFFTNIASKYIPVKPSFLNEYIIEKIIKTLG